MKKVSKTMTFLIESPEQEKAVDAFIKKYAMTGASVGILQEKMNDFFAGPTIKQCVKPLSF